MDRPKEIMSEEKQEEMFGFKLDDLYSDIEKTC